MFVFSVLVIIGLISFVLPTVVDQFVRSGAELPLTTLLLNISNNIVYIILSVILFSVFVFYLYKKYTSNDLNHIKAHNFFLKFPLIGKFILYVQLERYTKTMSLLLISGLNLDKAMIDAQIVVTNKFISRA